MKLQKNRMKLLFVMLMAIAYIGSIGTIKCRAEGVTEVKLYTVEDEERENEYSLKDIMKIPVNTMVTVTSDNPEVVSISCKKITVKKKGDNEEDDIEINMPFVLDRNHILADNEEDDLAVGEWYEKFYICAKKAGIAVVTISAQTGGEEVYSKTYQVTVEGVVPIIQINKKKLRTCDEKSLVISDVSCSGVAVTMSANKDKAIEVIYYVEENKKTRKKSIWIGKKPVTILCNANIDSSLELKIYPHKAGDITINVSAKQDELQEVTKKCKFAVTKYENPFKTFKIGNVNYAKYFKNNDTLGDKNITVRHYTLSKKLCKKTQGGKTFQYSMKKGYELVSIKYVPAGEWSVKPKKIPLKYGKSGSGMFPKSFWEMYIVYKDKKGKKYTNLIWFSASDWIR